MYQFNRAMKSIVAATFAFLASALLVPSDAFAACGAIEVSKGDVKVESGKDKKVSAAPAGTKVCQGDTVISGPQSRAKIKMEDGNELNVSPDSRIMLEQYDYKPSDNKKKVMLNVLYGKVRAATKEENMYNDKAADGQANTFQVKTKSAVAGVRGTDFLTSFDKSSNKSEVVTFRGKVDVGQPGPGGSIQNPVSVGAGQKTEALPGSPPSPPKNVPKSEMDKMNSDTKADNNAKSGDKSAGSDKKDGDKGDKKEDEGKKEDAKRDDGKKDDGKKDDGKKEDAKRDEPKREDGKKDEPKREDAKREEPKREEPKREEPKRDSARNGGGESNSGGSGGGGTAGSPGGMNGDGGGKNEGGQNRPPVAGPAPGGPAPGGPPAGGGMPGGMPDAGRAPAGLPPMPGGSMIDMGDLGRAPAGGPAMPTMPGGMPPMYVPPVMANLPPPVPVCDLCNRTIENGPAKVNIRIILGN